MDCHKKTAVFVEGMNSDPRMPMINRSKSMDDVATPIQHPNLGTSRSLKAAAVKPMLNKPKRKPTMANGVQHSLMQSH